MKKKVGILSMQRVINYGSYLQAYALKQLLLKHGAESVEFIDIIPGKGLPGYSASGLAYYISRFKAMMKVILAGNATAKKKTLDYRTRLADMMKKAWGVLGLKDYPMAPQVDLAVIGSDEVFHCCQKTQWGYTPQLYGRIPNAKEVVSYAGSFGATKLEMLKKAGVADEIGENLKCLKSISVRDDNSKFIVEQLTGITPLINIDPVLAYGYKKEIDKATEVDEKNYILVYSYPDRIHDKREVEAIRQFANQKGKKLICVMSRYDWCDRAIIPTPLELLGWFKNADYVITETFHGTIFSIITNRQFATIGRVTAIPKLTSMLRPYGLETRLVAPERTIESIFMEEIDYDKVNSSLSNLQKESEQYLDKILEE